MPTKEVNFPKSWNITESKISDIILHTMDNFGCTGCNLNMAREHRISSFMFHHQFYDASQLTVDFTKLETEVLEEPNPKNRNGNVHQNSYETERDYKVSLKESHCAPLFHLVNYLTRNSQIRFSTGRFHVHGSISYAITFRSRMEN